MENEARIAWGTYNFSSQSGRLSCMVLEAPFKRRIAGSGALPKIGTKSMVPCGQYVDINGAIQKISVQPPTGTVLCVGLSKLQRGSPIADAVVFVRIRPDGKTINIKARVPGDKDSLLPELVSVFDGVGDVLDYRQLKALGFVVDASFRDRFMHEEEIQECFVVTESKGVGSTVLVIENSGVKATVRSEPVRRMRIRRKE